MATAPQGVDLPPPPLPNTTQEPKTAEQQAVEAGWNNRPVQTLERILQGVLDAIKEHPEMSGWIEESITKKFGH